MRRTLSKISQGAVASRTKQNMWSYLGSACKSTVYSKPCVMAAILLHFLHVELVKQ